MVNKKYLLLAGLCSVIGVQAAFAQEGSAQWSGRDMTYRGQNYDVLDSSYVPGSRMEQHRKFLNHQYVFPAKPRNMVEVGFGGGLYNVMGDVPSLMLWRKGGYGFHAHIRKSWGYVISSRLQYNYGIAKGLQWQEAYNYAYNPAWNGYYDGAGNSAGRPVQKVHYNYRMESHQLNLDMIASTNNIRFHKARTGMSLYMFVGVGALAYNTRVNALDAAGTAYDFQEIVGTTTQRIYENRNDIRTSLQGQMDDTYETDAENERDRRRASIFTNKTLVFTPSVGFGAQFRLGKRVNLSLEDRISMPNDEDLLDGQRWAEQVYGSPIQTQNNDLLNYFSLGLNFNLGNSKKSVEPLYWINPLDFAYSELNYPRHMLLPEPVLPDADNDGITDQFDKCPGTPAGVAVDSHGCPLDTDGDGVPDFRDKQLITPTECQPVDADGVGKCPCPDGCITVAPPQENCANVTPGNITFSNKKADLSAAAKSQCAVLAAQLQANPKCNVIIIGNGKLPQYAGTGLSKLGWNRIEAIMKNLTETHGINRSRIRFKFPDNNSMDQNTVIYRVSDGQEGFDFIGQ